MTDIADRTYLWRGLELQHSDRSCGDPIRNPPFEVMRVTGIGGTSNRIGDIDFARNHGALPNSHYAESRRIGFEFQICHTNRETFEDRLIRLQTAFQVVRDPGQEGRLHWQPPGQERRFVRGRPADYKEGRRFGLAGRATAEPTAVIACADPRIYGFLEREVTLGIFDPALSAVNYPLDYPINWPAGGTSGGDVTAVNGGNFDAAPVIRFFGPTSGTATSVMLDNLTTGVSLTVLTDIGVGQVLTANILAYETASSEQVISLDGATRYGDWAQPRVPLLLVPGTNDLRFTAEGSTDGMFVTVTWRNTWM